MALRALCLCDGYGGFELGLRRHGIRTVARVERDSYAAATLVARMEESRLDPAPVWDDLTTFDGAAWRGRVDLVTAGFPCQPFSAAGERRGVDDERWLWPDIARIIADVGPRYVFLENVPGLVRHGLPHVLADLADDGFDAEWGLYSAADVGAPHRRERIWILADADGDGRESVGRRDVGHERHTDRQGGADVDDTVRRRHDAAVRQVRAGWVAAVVPGVDDVADTAGARRPGATGQRRLQRVEPGAHRFPPRPDDTDGWQRWVAAGGPQPSVRRGTDGRPVGLADALHLGGNGLVPAAAGEAFRQLLQRLGR